MKQSKIRWSYNKQNDTYSADVDMGAWNATIVIWRDQAEEKWVPGIYMTVQCHPLLEVYADGQPHRGLQPAKVEARRTLARLEDLLASAISEAMTQ